MWLQNHAGSALNNVDDVERRSIVDEVFGVRNRVFEVRNRPHGVRNQTFVGLKTEFNLSGHVHNLKLLYLPHPPTSTRRSTLQSMRSWHFVLSKLH